MAPLVPAEIDLFTVPHSRMKELVSKYTTKVQDVDYRNCQEVNGLLKELQLTLNEFKSHESIENMFIMDQLKNRLKQSHIYNSAVCDCHNDNRLQEMLILVKNGKKLWKTSIGERLHYGHELQKAFNEFVQEFLPHMEEEEKIFQPLLVEHFEYDELKVLKQVVLEQHELIKDPLYQEKYELDTPEMDSAIKDFRDLDSCCVSSLYEDDSLEIRSEESIECFNSQHDAPPLALPTEILIKIFKFLDPPDRGRCAQVCTLWNNNVYSSILWKEIYPVQWARDLWEFRDLNLSSMLHDEGDKSPLLKTDEDADVDESEEDFLDPLSQRESDFFVSLLTYFLPRVGRGVEKIVLDGGQGVSPRLLHRTLSYCPNLIEISATYTFFDYYTLKRLRDRGGLRKLRVLDLEGCECMDDQSLVELSRCLLPRSHKLQNSVQSAVLALQPFKSTHCRFHSKRPKSSDCSCHRGCNRQRDDALVNSINELSDGFEIEELGLLQSSSDSSPAYSDEESHYVVRSSRSYFEPTLVKINLSGCWRCTNTGLMALLDSGCLKNIKYLNLSSCFSLSGETLLTIAKNCLRMEPENLTYCCNIVNGPYSTQASGCDSISHPLKVCCRNSYMN